MSATTARMLTDRFGALIPQTYDPINDVYVAYFGGSNSDTSASWYTSTASYFSLLKLAIAVFVGAGSHVYGYDASDNLITDAWTLLGTLRTKTFTYTAGKLTAESDWV